MRLCELASGYVVKEAAAEELVWAIRAVAEGGTYLSPSISSKVVDGYLEQRARIREANSYGRLTPREREVLQLLAEGKRTSQIADLLFIGVKTVETHRWQIMNKLDIRNLADLTKYAIREGLTPLEL